VIWARHISKVGIDASANVELVAELMVHTL
jgi:hypothetical protein